MNYITEIKAFYDLVQVKRLSTGQIALWHALMNINNKCAWIEWFTVPNITLELLTGLTRQAIVKNRNILKQYNIIDFKMNGTKATSYMVKSLQVSLQDSFRIGLQDGLQDSLQDSLPLNKQDETKRNETYIKKHQKRNDNFFNTIWELYPKKLGKGSVKATQRDVLYKIGFDELSRCVKRYKKHIDDNGITEQFIKNGSTFFNSGYVDYLDCNYPEEEKPVIGDLSDIYKDFGKNNELDL